MCLRIQKKGGMPCAGQWKKSRLEARLEARLKDGILALKDIARYSGLSLAEVKKLQAAMA